MGGMSRLHGDLPRHTAYCSIGHAAIGNSAGGLRTVTAVTGLRGLSLRGGVGTRGVEVCGR